MNWRMIFKTLIQLGITVGLLYWVFRMVDISQVIGAVTQMRISFLLLSIPVLFINWHSRVQRWRVAAAKFDILIDWPAAIKSYLAGMTGAAVTPGRIGEYLRIFYLNDPRRPSMAAALTIERLSGGGPLLVAGAAAVLIYGEIAPIIALLMAIGGTLQIVLLHWKVGWLVIMIRRLPQKWQKNINKSHWLEYISRLSPADIFEITLQSMIQYLTFLLLFTLTVMGLVQVPFFPTLIVLTIVFAIKTFAAFSLGELGVREVAAIYFLGTLGVADEAAVAASLLVWLYDVMLLAVGGIPFLLKFKWNAEPLKNQI
ncbi:MAG TPA: flippase-like domain-containing protein [Candidatus Marinimicrobia bacterium]|nr:flippase-like domain-containing protein [Candidatus Neomarinimicrobiota bacterium]